MGKIAELQAKKKEGKITAEEQKELDMLLAEAKEVGEDESNDEDNEENEDEEVDKLAQKLADNATDRISKSLEKVMEKMTAKADKKVTDVKDNTSKFIVDAKYGKKNFAEAEAIKIAVPNREGKATKEVSLKTLHLAKALISGDKQKLQLLTEGTGSQGGFLVPEEFANMIVEDIRDIAVMRTLASSMTISGDTLHLPGLAHRPKAKWRGETESKHTSTVDFGENVFTPYSIASIVGLSNELAADASLGVNGSIVNYVSGLMAQSISEEEEKAFWVGSGTGQPTGVNGYSVRTITSGVTDAERADAIIAGFRRTPQGYRNKGAWIGNSGTLENIDQLKDNDGRYLLTELADGPTQRLKGRPVYEQNDLPGGTLLYGDFSYYQIVDREGIEVRISDEATVAGRSAFEDNLTYVRVEKRVDGELTLPDAITKVVGLGTP